MSLDGPVTAGAAQAGRGTVRDRRFWLRTAGTVLFFIVVAMAVNAMLYVILPR